MNHCNYIGKMGERIARTLFPHMTIPTILEDQNGFDGRLGQKTIQVKADQRIEQSQKIYHEYWEKSIGREDQPWRRSPSPVDLFLFITKGLYVLLPADALAKLEENKMMKKILPTSMGFLIPLTDLRPFTKEHSHWVSYESWQLRSAPIPPPRQIEELSWEELDGCDKPGAVLG